jgi:hypothetical protein
MCNCKTEIEQKLTERFAQREALATGHHVELMGYGLAIVGNTMTLRPYMEARATADFLLKKGGRKHRAIKQSMAFSFCPFCGEEISKAEAAASV